MTYPDTPQVRSIRQRLTNLANNFGIRPMEAQRLYFLDGFLARLAQSPHQQQFILGGGLFLYKVVLVQPNAVFLDPTFPIDPQQVAGWQAFVATTTIPGGLTAFADVIDLIRRLYLPVFQGLPTNATWDHGVSRW